MSSFDDAEFSVIAPSGSMMPDMERGNDGLRRYSCQAQFTSRAALASMRDACSSVEFKQTLGKLEFNAHVNAGYGSGTLEFMFATGETRTLTAFLVSFTGVEGDGRHPGIFRARLEFVIIP